MYKTYNMEKERGINIIEMGKREIEVYPLTPDETFELNDLKAKDLVAGCSHYPGCSPALSVFNTATQEFIYSTAFTSVEEYQKRIQELEALNIKVLKEI